MTAHADDHDTCTERMTPVVRRLVLLRHGQTQYNADSRMQGQLDIALTERGRLQAKRAAAVLKMRMPLEIVSSDLIRAKDTAQVLADETEMTISLDERLRETHLGQWQGLTHIEVDSKWPGLRRSWRDDARWAPPGGESRVDVAARSHNLVNELVRTRAMWGREPHADAPIVLVAHGGLIAALTASLMDLPIDNWPSLGGLANTSWVQLSGHEVSEDTTGADDPSSIMWRLDVWNASSEVAASDVL